MKLLFQILLLCCLTKASIAQEISPTPVLLYMHAGLTRVPYLNAIGYGSLGVAWSLNRFFSLGPSVHVMGFQHAPGFGIPITGDIMFSP